MNNLDFNVPVLIFIIGAMLFLFAPTGVLPTITANQLYLIALVIESVGVTVAFIVYFRERLSDYFIQED